MRTTRRALFGLIGRIAAAIQAGALFGRSVPATGDVPVRASRQVQVLAGMIQELFPHQGLPPDYYTKTAETLLQRDAGAAETLREGTAELDGLCGEAGWAGAAADERTSALMQLEGREFFQFVRSSAVELIYRDPVVWELIGYGGNALERGGYLHRGFNDIDWLPPAPKS